MNTDYKILITGSRGFIGKNLKEHLSDSYKIFAPLHNELELLDENSVKNYIEENGINFIIHCANCGGSRKLILDENQVLSNNLRMFFNLTRCLKPSMRMIYFGSGAEYDKRNNLVKVKENNFEKNIPQDAYGYSKYIVSQHTKKCDNILNLRLFGVYGKYEDYSFRFISNAIIKNLLKLDIEINQNVYFDYLFVDDFVKIVDKFIQNKPSKNIINVTPNDKIDLITVSNIINEIGSHKSKIIIKNEGLNNEYTGDNSLLLNELNNYKFTDYKDGIKKLYDYYLENIDNINLSSIKDDKLISHCTVKTERA